MIEEFLNWFLSSDTVINPVIRDMVDYKNYFFAIGGLGAVAVLIESLKNAVKNQVFSVSNAFMVSTFLLLTFGMSMKPLTDFIAYLAKQTDMNTDLSEDEKLAMANMYRAMKIIELGKDYERLEEAGGGDVLAKAKIKIRMWTEQAKLQNSMQSPGVAKLFGFDASGLFEKAIGSFRPLLKLYFALMMNLYYIIIPIAFIFSIFKPGHFLKPLAKFTLYGCTFFIINLMEWVYFQFFLDRTITNGGIMSSLVIDAGAVLIGVVMVFVYIRAMEVARDMFPLSGQDAFGPMVGQALAATTFLLMSKTGMKGAPQKPTPPSGGGSGRAGGAVDITTS